MRRWKGVDRASGGIGARWWVADGMAYSLSLRAAKDDICWNTNARVCAKPL